MLEVIVTFKKHKPTNVGRIVLERQARKFISWSFSPDQFFFIGEPTGIRTTDLSIHDHQF